MKAERLARFALSLEGVTEAPHFERRAFKARTIFVTLAPDGLTANLKLEPEEQQHWCDLLGDGLVPVPNAWGKRGWTQMQLLLLSDETIRMLLRLAWAGCSGGGPSRRRRVPDTR